MEVVGAVTVGAESSSGTGERARRQQWVAMGGGAPWSSRDPSPPFTKHISVVYAAAFCTAATRGRVYQAAVFLGRAGAVQADKRLEGDFSA